MPRSPQDLHKKLLGKKGEALACKYLKKQRYKILHTNYKTSAGEADIVCRDGDEIVFVEVKTRTSDAFGTPAEAVTAKKRERYIRIAQCYWKKTEKEPNARFDVIEVWADGKIEHLKNAF